MSEPKVDMNKVIMSSIVNIKPQPDNTTEAVSYTHLTLPTILRV